ncbi:hypothetical protein QJS10_CPB15g00954 [Acorus calamus]|uniref:FAS1 domain-containing protein n=1 Tax=Acorus calamus TaxID=4465 RepID=A0AAV9D3T6_ACOCL|nr:hypothetical protein QJS10_CPB15g00954 [Acorus calamus]
MSLTLQLASQTLFPSSASVATLFAASDAAFIESGQPSLSLLRYHLSPLRLTPADLCSLPSGAEIPTFFLNHSLTVTSAPSYGQISINGVPIDGFAVYDDGSLVIHRIPSFFKISASGSVFAVASDLLRSMNRSAIAGFLDLQMMNSGDRAATVFAPPDDQIGDCEGSFGAYAEVLKRHVVPFGVTWSDLVGSPEGTALMTLSAGSTIDVTRDGGGTVVLNGVSVDSPDFYGDGSLTVHLVREALTPSDGVVADWND